MLLIETDGHRDLCSQQPRGLVYERKKSFY